MAKTNKIIKFEIESASGTMTDLTHYINHASFDGLVDVTPPPASFWRHPIVWIKRKMEERRAKKFLMGFPIIEVTFEHRGVIEVKPWRSHDWYKWN